MDEMPLAEKAYLSHSNNFRLIHSMIDIEDGSFDIDLARMEFYVSNLNIYIAPFYLYTGGAESSDNTYGASLGAVIFDGFRVFTSFSKELDYEINVDIKYVTELGNGRAINVEFGYEKFDDSDEDELDDSGIDDYFGVGMDYYFDNTFSVGVFFDSGLGSNQFFNSADLLVGEDSIGLRTEKFFSEQFSLAGSYKTSDTIDALEISLAYRL